MQRIPIGNDTSREPDPAQVAFAVSALCRGRLVILPTETVYGLTAHPGRPAAVERLRQIKGRQEDAPFTLHVASYEAVGELASEPSERIARFMQRCWPGPVTFILDRKGGGTVGLRVPAHPFTLAVIRELGVGLYMSSVNRRGEAPVSDTEAIARDYDAADFFFDAGAPRLGIASTVLAWDGRRMQVLREGFFSKEEMLASAAALVLFVCTGNTCRSPLAEFLAREMVAREFDVEPEAVLARGLLFRSAGMSSLYGMPASDGALRIAKKRGLDLSAHRSTPLSLQLAMESSRIYCMSPQHRLSILDLAPELEPGTTLLRPDGQAIRDPFGGPDEAYGEICDEIAGSLQERLPELLTLI